MRDYYVNLLDWVLETKTPIGLVHEREGEAAFLGVGLVGELYRSKNDVVTIYNWIMYGCIGKVFAKKSSRSLYDDSIRYPYRELRVCGTCALDEEDEISSLTLLQVLNISQSS